MHNTRFVCVLKKQKQSKTINESSKLFMMNQEKLFTEKFDTDFLEIGTYDEDPNDIGFYRNFRQMLPWVGCEFENNEHKKILFIGESHYLPECINDENLLTPEGWYNQGEYNLDENSDEYSWTNTREIVGLRKREKGLRSRRFVICGLLS